MKSTLALAALSASIASMFALGDARAQQTEVFSANPSARCQPATRASEAQFRKRPLAMVNEGDTTAFVNCAFELEIEQSVDNAVEIWVSNTTGASMQVTCTGVSGWEGRTGNQYIAQTVTVPANAQGETPFFWEESDFTAGSGGLISVACALPPGAAINDTYAYSVTPAAPV